MEGLNPTKKESILNKVSKVAKLAKITVLSKLIDNSKLDKNLANNLYANRILEEELMSPNISYKGFEPELPKGSKLIDIHGSQYLQIDGRMYYIRNLVGGFDLIDNTYDFMPRPGELYPFKTKLKYQKKYNVSDKSIPINDGQFYKFNETKDNLDNWIIHNDTGKINKNRLNEDETWWLKGEPYKAMERRSLIKDTPEGRHLFVKQSALESSIGKPLDQHRELMGDIIKKGDVVSGGITITPTSEADLPKIKGLKSFTYNPIIKSIERGIFYNPKEPKDENHLTQEDKNKKEKLNSRTS